MAGEILINDGGAPARILPFIANAQIDAGECVVLAATGKVALASDADMPLAGVALTNATADGEMCNVITGSGVILNVKCDATVNRGDGLMTDGSTAGQLIITDDDANSSTVGYALEDANGGLGDADGLTKVLVV
jgi:hypothetical protein